jgi:hypothetical protein
MAADPADFLLDLETKLAADRDGAVKAGILKHLSDIKLQATQAIGRGVAPAEFKRLEALRAAVEAAESVINGVKLAR